MKAVTEITKDELTVTLSFFEIGGYTTTTTFNNKVSDLQSQIDALKDRVTAVEADLETRTFG